MVVVKREYTSELRAAQARETRAADRGGRGPPVYPRRLWKVTTIDAIAATAGVGRKTVFASAGGKAELLKLALNWAVVGDDKPIPVAEARACKRSVASLIRTRSSVASSR